MEKKFPAGNESSGPFKAGMEWSFSGCGISFMKLDLKSLCVCPIT